MVLLLILLGLGLGARPGLAHADAPEAALAVLSDDPMRAEAFEGLLRGVRDSGRKIRSKAEVTAIAGAPLSALAAACTGHLGCFDGIAKSIGSELYLVDIERGKYVTQVSLQQGLPGGGGVRQQLTLFADTEIEAAAYGLVFQVTGTRGEGVVTVASQPEGADVRVAGRLVGQTPLQGISVPAGAVRIDIESKGFSDFSRLVAVAPGAIVRVTQQLEVKIDEFAVAELDLGDLDHAPALTAEAAKASTSGVGLEPTDAARLALPPLAATKIEATPRRRSLRLPTWIALGLGVLAVGGGATFGLDASGRARAARAQTVQLEVQRFNDDARRSAMRANILFGVGAVALGTATYFLVGDLR